MRDRKRPAESKEIERESQKKRKGEKEIKREKERERKRETERQRERVKENDAICPSIHLFISAQQFSSSCPTGTGADTLT